MKKKKFIPRPKESASVIRKRWHRKREQVEILAEKIRSLRWNVSRDLKSDNEKDYLTALVIALLDKTSERIGNDGSASNGHFGVTGFKKKHITVIGNKVHLKYTGKSGVDHEKSFSDEKIAKALKRAIKNSPNENLFVTSDGFQIKQDRINRFLEDFCISAKDIRGFSCNNQVVKKLKEITPEEKETQRKKQFLNVIRSVAKKIGHGSGTLRKHYLLPEIEPNFIEKGKVIEIDDVTKYNSGGAIVDEEKLIVKEKKKIGRPSTKKKHIEKEVEKKPELKPEPKSEHKNKLVDKQKPSKGDFNNLYKEHHDAWDKMQDIEDNVCEEVCEKYTKELLDVWESELKPHFKDEEENLFPYLNEIGKKKEVDELIDEHKEFDSLIRIISKNKNNTSKIKYFCEKLKKHIKREEKIMGEFHEDPYKKEEKNRGGDVEIKSKTSNLTLEQQKLVRTPEFKKWFGDWEIIAKAKSLSHNVKGIYAHVFNDDTEQALFEIAVQANGQARSGITKSVGEEIVELALQLYPNAKLGDKYVPVVSKVVDENREPLVVYHSTYDKEWGDENEVWFKDSFVFDPHKEGKETYEKRRDIKHGGIYFSRSKEVAEQFGKFTFEFFLNFKDPIVLDAKGENIRVFNHRIYSSGDRDVIVKRTEDQFLPSYTIITDIFITSNPSSIKLADGRNVKFDINNPDVRMKEGGDIKTKEELAGRIFYHGTALEDWKNTEHESYLFLVDDFEVAKNHALSRVEEDGVRRNNKTPIVVKVKAEQITNLKWEVDDDLGNWSREPFNFKTWQDSYNAVGSFVVVGKYNIDDFEILKLDKPEMKKGGEAELSERDKKYIDYLLEYVYYNNPEEEDEYLPSEAPDWIKKGSQEYLKKKGITKIYRGVQKGSHEGDNAFSWTYDKEVAKHFGDKILEKPLPKDVVSVEFVFDLVKNQKNYKYSSSSIADYVKQFEGGESEVILANIEMKKGGDISDEELILVKQKLISILSSLNKEDLQDFVYHIGAVESDYVDDLVSGYENWINGLQKDELDMILWRMKMPYFYVFSPKDNYTTSTPVPSKFATYDDFYEKKYKKGGALNPFAVCTSSIGKKEGTTKRSDWDKDAMKRYESCVLAVKDKKAEGGELTIKRKKVYEGDKLLRDLTYEEAEKYMSLYHEKKGNFMIPKGFFVAWMYDEANFPEKINSGEYDFLMFPPPIKYQSFRLGYGVVESIWKANFQKLKGAKHLLGMVQGWYDEEKKKVVIQYMSVRPSAKRNRINTFLVKGVKNHFETDEIEFDEPTKEGTVFMEGKTYGNGGSVKNFMKISNKDGEQVGVMKYETNDPERNATISDMTALAIEAGYKVEPISESEFENAKHSFNNKLLQKFQHDVDVVSGRERKIQDPDQKKNGGDVESSQSDDRDYYNDYFYGGDDEDGLKNSMVSYIEENAEKFEKSFPESERFVLSHEEKITFRKQTEFKEELGMKPKGLWYGLGMNWIYGASRFARHLAYTYEYIHKLTINESRVCILDTPEKYVEFTKKYGEKASPRIDWMFINWNKVSKDYSGIETHNPRGVVGDLGRQVEVDGNKIDTMSYFNWLLSWDVSGGCIWAEDAIKSIDLVFDWKLHKVANMKSGGGLFDENYAIAYRSIRGDWKPEYKGWQYYSSDKDYSQVWGRNTKKFKIDLSNALNLEKWNELMREAEPSDTWKHFQIGDLQIEQKYFMQLELLANRLGVERYHEFLNEFENSDVVYGKEAGSNTITYAVRNQKAVEFIGDEMANGGSISDEEKSELYSDWRELINMSASELEKFYNSEEGKEAGLSKKEADDLGIHSGRESAKWIMKMKKTPNKDWTPKMWEWAKRQISFVKRMKGNKGDLIDGKGNKTRKHLALLIWGHNPKK